MEKNSIKRKENETDLEFFERKVWYYNAIGYNINEIADIIKCNVIDVYNIIATHNSNAVSESERAKMLELRASGMSLRAIAKATGRSASCVKRRLDSPAKLPMNNIEVTLTQDDLNLIKTYYTKGKTFTYISKKLDNKISSNQVRYRIEKMNIWRANNSELVPLTFSEKRQIKSLIKKGKNIYYISKEIGRTVQCIDKYINK